MDTLSCDEEFSPLLETVWVTESNLGQGSTTARVVDDILEEAIRENDSRTVYPLSGGDVGIFKGAFFYLHDPLDVPMAFSEVNTAEFGSTFSVLDVGFEYRPRTFSLSPDHTSHGVLKQSSLRQLPG